ncbi:hypothetical protein Tco_0835149 [Tanacetum coccineum]
MVQNVQGRQSQGYLGNAGNNQASGAQVINAVKNTRANQPRVIRYYNCKGEGHMAKQFTTRKRVKDSEWFKEKMLLAQAQEAGVVLDEEEHDLLADSLEDTNDYCDDEATTNAIFMANLSPVCSINDDIVAPRYDSKTLFEVPHYDTYHDSDVVNSNIQELGYIENIISTNESMMSSRVIDDADNYVPPPVQKDDMMLSVIEQMKSQVENCNKVLRNLNKAHNLLTTFDECIKRRTALSPHQIGSWEQSDVKVLGVKRLHGFLEVTTAQVHNGNYAKWFGINNEVKEMKDIFELMEDEVDQCYVAKKCFEIEKKQLLINNDRLLEENIASDIMCTYLRSLNEVDNCGKCKSLDIVLLDIQESNKSLSELRKRFAKLEESTLLLILLFKIIKNK